MAWHADPDADDSHVYRGDLASLGFDYYGVCRDDLIPSRNANYIDDPETPLAGAGFFYEVTHSTRADGEASLGVGSCAERSNYQPCP
jgi:hypothetical protein